MMHWRTLLMLVVLVLASGGARAMCLAACTCTVSTSGLSFGTVNPLNLAATDGTGSLTLQCQATGSFTLNYRIELGPGGSGNASARRLSQGGLQMGYNLYTDTSRSMVWGDGSGGTVAVEDSIVLDLLGMAPPRQHWVYGRIPGGQTTVAPGAYSDSVVVTVTYF